MKNKKENGKNYRLIAIYIYIYIYIWSNFLLLLI